MEVVKFPFDQLPFREDEMVGPEDRPGSVWELALYDWRVTTPVGVKEFMDEMDGTSIRAVQLQPKEAEGIIYARACHPTAPKAHHVSVSGDHRTATFSLFTPLMAMGFPRLRDGYKAIFKCEPRQYGDVKVLVINVAGYRVEPVDRDDQKQKQQKQEQAEKQEQKQGDAAAAAQAAGDGGQKG